MKIKIGTRGSKLALWQAEHIKSSLEENGNIKAELVIIETKGDKILDKSLSKIGSKGVFTEELETALRKGEIDIAVHSAKDVMAILPNDLPLIAFGKREKACDVLVSYNKDILIDDEITIGTSSTRRVAILKSNYPKAKIVDMRGNLQTRFQKMKDGSCDAMILAYAGVNRMKLNKYIVQELDMKQFVPPVGQGSVAIQICIDKIDIGMLETIQNQLNHEETAFCIEAERAYLAVLEGGCSIPSYGHATHKGMSMTMTAGIVSLDGNKKVEKTIKGDLLQSEEIGEQLAEWVLKNGGKEILKSIKEKK